MNEYEEAQKIELHDAKLCLEHGTFLEGLNLEVMELQAWIIGPQEVHIVIAAEDVLSHETVVGLAYHGSFTVWWVDWSPGLEAYEEETDFDWEVPPLSKRRGYHCYVGKEEDADANDHPLRDPD